jgi:predicted permease
MIDWKPEIRQRLASSKLEPTREAEIVEELSQHLDDRYADLRAEGATEEEARRAALVELSDSKLLARELRRAEPRINYEPVVLGARRKHMLNDLSQDLRYGIRMLGKNPGFTAIAVLTLALGIGANTAIFSVVNAVLLQPLPYPHPEGLVMVWEKIQLSHYQNDQNTPAPANFADWKKENSVFEDMAAIGYRSFNLTGDGEPLRVEGQAVSAALFSVLQIEPALGRAFTDDEDRFGGPHVVVLSYGLWASRFGGDANILGKTILMDGEGYTVVGVMPQGFQFPDPDDQLWVPIALSPAELANRGSHYLRVVARLKPGVSLTQAQSQMNTIAEGLTEKYPATNTGGSVNVIPLHEQVVANVRPALLVLLAATGFILLIVCANLANLLLSRATTRSRELAIRMALGASRSRIVRQLLTESVLLGVAGGLLGLLLAFWGVDALRFASPPDLPRVAETAVNAPVLVFGVTISILTGLLFGIAPALQSARRDVHNSLSEDGRESARGPRVAMRKVLVVSETALGVIVLVGAGLLLRSFLRLEQVDLGFEPQDVLTMRVILHGTNYSKPPQRTAFYQRTLERIESLPGVKSAAAISFLPLTNSGGRSGFTIEGGMLLDPGQLPFAVVRTVSPGYFHTMQIPFFEGRDFSWSDTPESSAVLIINQAMASLYWPNENALGKRIKQGRLDSPVPWQTVVGIVDNVREFDPVNPPRPAMYFPAGQSTDVRASLRDWVVRASGDPLSLSAAVRSAVWDVDKDLPISRLQTMEKVRAASVASQQFNLLLMGLFGCLALVLATTGLYGVTAYSVAQRTREIGIRLAIGAQTGDVLKLVMGQGMRLTVIGIAVGLAGAVASTRLMSSLLFGVSATDPMTFAVVSLLLTAVALLACYIPARRAMKVDPIIALRYE